MWWGVGLGCVGEVEVLPVCWRLFPCLGISLRKSLLQFDIFFLLLIVLQMLRLRLYFPFGLYAMPVFQLSYSSRVIICPQNPIILPSLLSYLMLSMYYVYRAIHCIQ
jgi:hypothetical protein